MMPHVWGIDLGGTKIEGVVLDPTRKEPVIARLRHPTNSHLGYDFILSQIRRVIDDLSVASGLPVPSWIGIGTPGVRDPATGQMKNSNTTCLNGKELQLDLEKSINTNFRMANDANCFALAEATLGAAKGSEVVFGVILGTGVGGGVVVRGQAISGKHGIAGEWGHNLIDASDGARECYCGRKGCVETVLSGPALTRFYHEKTNSDLKLPEIVELSKKGDSAATATMERLLDYLGKALGPIINILDPDSIVLGGGVGNIDLLYTEEARTSIERYVFNPGFDTGILRPELGDSAGVFGAAMLVAEPVEYP